MRVKNGLTHFIWTNHLRRALTWRLKSPEINLLTSGHKTTTLLMICLCCMSPYCLFRKDKHLQKWAFTDNACLRSVLKFFCVLVQPKWTIFKDHLLIYLLIKQIFQMKWYDIFACFKSQTWSFWTLYMVCK